MNTSVRDLFSFLKRHPFAAEKIFAVASALVLLLAPLAVPGFRGRTSGEDELGLGQPEMYLSADHAEIGSRDPETPETPPRNVLSFTTYTVEKGDTVSEIAHRMDLNQDSLISCNEIERARLLQIGTVLQVPNMNGIMHTVKAKDSLEKLAETYNVSPEQILEVNNIAEFSHSVGQKIFIPEAKLPSIELRRVWGELFRYPSRGWISSPYGYRADPFTGRRRFHNGIDIAGAHGSAVLAALEGRVIETGFNSSSGNYIVVSHVGGYTTFYAHLETIHVKKGAWVNERQRIGDLGNTGYSTGSHLHFTIFRWGKSINPVLLLH